MPNFANGVEPTAKFARLLVLLFLFLGALVPFKRSAHVSEMLQNSIPTCSRTSRLVCCFLFDTPSPAFEWRASFVNKSCYSSRPVCRCNHCRSALRCSCPWQRPHLLPSLSSGFSIAFSIALETVEPPLAQQREKGLGWGEEGSIPPKSKNPETLNHAGKPYIPRYARVSELRNGMQLRRRGPRKPQI